MALTAQEAIDLLRANPSAYTTPEAIRNLAAQLDITASGAVTVLYGGRVDGVDSGNQRGQRHLVL